MIFDNNAFEPRTLTSENINSTVQVVMQYLQDAHVARRNIIRMTLVLEEALLHCREHFGDETEYRVILKKRFVLFFVEIEIKGQQYNPFDLYDDADDGSYNEIMENIVHPALIKPVCKYYGHVNKWTLYTVRDFSLTHLPAWCISLLGVMLAVALGVLCRNLPVELQGKILSVTTIISSKYLAVIAGVMTVWLYFYFASTVLTFGDVASAKTTGVKSIRLCLRYTFLMMAVACIVCYFVFPSGNVSSNINTGKSLEMIWNIIPTNPVAPFIEGNFLQIFILSLVTGGLLILLGDKVNQIRNLILEVNVFLNTLFKGILAPIQVLVVLMIFNLITKFSPQELMRVWKLVAVIYFVETLTGILSVVYCKFRWKISNMYEVLKMMWPNIFKNFVTCTPSIVLTERGEVMERLGMEKNFAKFSTIITFVVVCAANVMLLVISAFFAANHYNIQITLPWLLATCFIVFQVSYASPKVAGGTIVSLNLLLTQLGLPGEFTGLLIIGYCCSNHYNGGIACLIRDLGCLDMGFIQGKIDRTVFFQKK